MSEHASLKRVLLVEDDDLLRKSLSGLVGALGYEPVAVESAEEALRRVHQVPVDLVLTDYRLLAMNGIDLIVNLRKSGLNVPCVLISGFLSEEVRQRARDIRVAEVLRKPGDIARLGDLLEQFLGAVPPGRPV
ncbi:MAG TPA: response regulator [Bacteroidota bacterium]